LRFISAHTRDVLATFRIAPRFDDRAADMTPAAAAIFCLSGVEMPKPTAQGCRSA
jgi:hypothetical protein